MFERESARLAHIWQSKKDSLNFTHGITNGELGLITVCIAFLRYFWGKHYLYREKFRETSNTFPPSSWTSLTPYYNLISERWGLNLEERSEERLRGEDSSEKLKKRKKKSRIVKLSSFHFIVIAGLILNNGQIFAGSKPITLRSNRRNVAPLARHVRHRAVRITICRHASPRHVSCTRVTCIALTPACTFHGGTCFGKGRSHFVIAFLPHPEENPATYSSSTRATDLRQLRDLCKPFSLSLSLVSIISLDLPFISTNISRPLPLFSTYLPTPFSFRSKLFEEERSKKRKKNSVVGKRVEKIELAFVSSSGFSGLPGETRLWKIIIARGGVGSFRRA